METWPLMNKNKVEDSQVHIPVEGFSKLEDERVKLLAQKVRLINQIPCSYL
jgi:histone-lysine N-methyltransferase SETD2